MITEREVVITVSSCIATAGFLEGPYRIAKAEALGQLHAAAARVGGFGLSFPEVRRRILRPVQAGLISRYGLAEGARLNRQFLVAFEA